MISNVVSMANPMNEYEMISLTLHLIDGLGFCGLLS